MKEALNHLSSQSVIDCGEGGTVFRFIALRASRIAGEHLIKGSDRLLSRPQAGLMDLLKQLGVKAEMTSHGLKIQSEGWKFDSEKCLVIDRSQSSQFASGLLLNAWELEKELKFKFNEFNLSESYWDLTCDFVKSMGMKLQEVNGVYTIPPEQKIEKDDFEVEADVSSIFSFAAAAALAGTLEVTNWPEKTTQPDRNFLKAFEQMGITYEQKGHNLKVYKTSEIKGIDFDISQCPDLFPILSLVCGYAEGNSLLYGAPHLLGKESNRVKKTCELLNKLGILAIEKEDGLYIEGNGSVHLLKSFEYDSDLDHRMAMAAGIAQVLGHDIRVINPQVVSKSCPEFWSIIS
jgi:3-phosphoshikimate 1-carboxyvinyltransferase